MRWLLIDAGNTALKWEVFTGATVQWPESGAESGPTRWRGTVAVDAPDLALELARACSAASALTGTPAPTAVMGCAVTSEARIRMIEMAIRSANAPAVRWLGAEAQFDHDGIQIRNGYTEPERLGGDRWHALIGARSRFPRGNLAVISAGTATTVDVLTGEGEFLGGVIAPGLDLMRSSLAQGTARLPVAEGNYAEHPQNTDDAITTGVQDAQLGLIERRLRRMRASVGGSIQVVLCGGNAAQLLPLLQSIGGLGRIAQEPDLVLRGLWHHARALAAQALSAPSE